MEKIYFKSGDLVQLKQDIPNKPVMVVKNIAKSVLRNEEKKSTLMGVHCFWFTSDGTYQKEVFSTKDIVHVKK